MRGFGSAGAAVVEPVQTDVHPCHAEIGGERQEGVRVKARLVQKVLLIAERAERQPDGMIIGHEALASSSA